METYLRLEVISFVPRHNVYQFRKHCLQIEPALLKVECETKLNHYSAFIVLFVAAMLLGWRDCTYRSKAQCSYIATGNKYCHRLPQLSVYQVPERKLLEISFL